MSSSASSSASSSSRPISTNVGRRSTPRPPPGSAGRSIGQDDQHRQAGGRPAEDLEQVARQRVDPVAVLEDEDERLARRPGAAGTVARRSSSDALRSFASSAPSASLSGISSPRTVSSSGARATSAGSIAVSAASTGATLARPRSSSSSTPQQAPPDLAPDEVARVRAERLALPERDEQPAPAGDPDELRDEARLAHAGLGGDPDDPAVARERRPRGASSSVASSSRRPTRSSS